MYKKGDLLYTLLHVPIDTLALILAFSISYWLRGDGLEIYRLPFPEYLGLAYKALPIWILIFALQGLYSKRNLFASAQNIFHIAIGSLAGWAAFVVYLVFLKNEQSLVFPRLLLVYLLILSFVFVYGGRLLLRMVQFFVRSAGYGRSRLLLVGSGVQAEQIESSLLERSDTGINFIKRINPETHEDMVKEIKKYHIDEVILAHKGLNDNQLFEYVRSAQDLNVVTHMIPNMFEIQASNVLFHTMAGTPILTFRQTPLDGWGRIVKRIIDTLVAVTSLIILSPFLLIISLIIKITDPGPVLYGHARISRSGKKIKVYKFRTMMTKYCVGPGFNPKSEIEIFKELGRDDLIEEFKRDQKVKDDPRITRMGKFLRKTSLDELPQLFNVLRGELSLVGPRPIVEDELKRYGRWGSYLLSIKPGMTGLWQVSGRNDVSYEERVKIDTHYVQHWSLWQDFVILIKTALIVIVGKSGY